MYGSQPNIAHLANQSPSTNKKPIKLAKAQSFRHQKTDGLSTPKFLKKFSFRSRSKETTPRASKKFSFQPDRILENQAAEDFNRNPNYLQANSRDVTSAVVDCNGARLVNEYWGVSLEVPPNALPTGVRQEIYFVITDPRLCENAPPLDLENGTRHCIDFLCSLPHSSRPVYIRLIYRVILCQRKVLPKENHFCISHCCTNHFTLL